MPTQASPIPHLSANLGANLRFVRERRDLTQDQLARLCDVPRSTIAQLETGGANPTLAVLAKVSDALGLTLEELLSSPRAEVQLFASGSLPVVQRGLGRQVRVQRLLPDPIPAMEIDRLALEPGARMAGVPHRRGTREYLFCETGSITVWAAGERHDLGPGDVLAFQGDQAHSYHNDTARPAVGFSVVTLVPSGAA